MKTSSSKILIIDDSPSMTAALRHALADRFILRFAANGETGLAMFQQFQPDIILLDVEMPGIDGYEVCKRLRAANPDSFVKILMISVKTDLEKRLKGYTAGADDYIPKPFVPEELVAKIRVFLRLQAVERELRRTNDELNWQVAVRTEQLLNAEKMAALGRHTAGIVHNLNNPLQAVMGLSDILSNTYPADKAVMLLKRAALEMKSTVCTILQSGRCDAASGHADVDLNDVIQDQIALMQATCLIKNAVECKLDLRPLPAIRGTRSHFSQIIGNIVKNAVEAMYDTPLKILSIRSEFDGSAIVVRVSDTGGGIPESEMPHIFDPFHTTKPLTASNGRPTGTGIGLASVKEMMDAYSGRIDVASREGEGTTFTLRFLWNPSVLLADCATTTHDLRSANPL